MTSLAEWLRAKVPTREQLERNRFIKPFAKNVLRSELWRFTRRSVPRGVALGLFIGVMIPLAHFVVATLLAVFVRANIPAALLATFIGFPVIYIGLVAAADRIGSWLLHVDSLTVVEPIGSAMQATETDHLLQYLTREGINVALGLFVEATVLASVGYVLSSYLWRWWIGRKRKARLLRGRLGPI